MTTRAKRPRSGSPADCLFRFFSKQGRTGAGSPPRRATFDVFTPEEFVAIVRLLKGRDGHDILAYANTFSVSSMEITPEDVRQAAGLLTVKDVLES